MKEVEVYTDGACRGNPGRGGYGAVLKYRDFRKELSGGFRLTTNNRMEVFAVIAALEALREPCILTIRSDSRYLIDTMEKGWLERWRKNGWKNRNGDPVRNDIDRVARMSDQPVDPDVRFRGPVVFGKRQCVQCQICRAHRIDSAIRRGRMGAFSVKNHIFQVLYLLVE